MQFICHAIMGEMGLFDSKLPISRATSSCIPNTLKIALYYFIVTLSWSTPPPPCPSTTIFLHFFMQLSLFILTICPNHLSLPLCMQFPMLTNQSIPQSSPLHAVSYAYQPQIDLSNCYTSLVPSSCNFYPALPSRARSSYHREQHSLHMSGKLFSFMHSERQKFPKFLPVMYIAS